MLWHLIWRIKLKKEEIQKIRELWQKEADEWLIRAINQDVNEYPKEVIAIIQEEAEKRGLIKKYKAENNLEAMQLSPKAANIKDDIDEKIYSHKTSTIIKRLLISIPIVLGGLATIPLAGIEDNEHLGRLIYIVIIIALSAIWGFRNPILNIPNKKRLHDDIIVNKKHKT